MLEMYKGRKMEVMQEVKVYFNLHKKMFSVKCAETGLVLAHGNDIVLAEPKFEVHQKGRERVIKEQKKNVHAYVTGKILQASPLPLETSEGMKEVYYNPYKTDKFLLNGKDANSQKLGFAFLTNKKVVVK